MRTACPACGGVVLEPVETIETARIAAAWARQPSFSSSPPEAVEEMVRSDIGGDHVRFLRCGTCQLEVAEPGSTWRAEHYPEDTYGLAWDHARALALLASEPPLRILELGCSDGRFVEAAAALGHGITGLDFSTSAVTAGRGLGLDLRVADATGLSRPLNGECDFGAVALFQIIEHLEEPDVVFSELARIAGPGALLLLGCPAPDRYTRRFPHPDHLGVSDFWDYPPQHSLRWTPAALRAFLGRHGWRIEWLEAEPFSICGAAAHMVALHGSAAGWLQNPIRRRLETMRWMARIGRTRGLTGVRLFVAARRSGSRV